MTETLRLRDFSHEYFQHFVTLEGRLWRSLWMLVSQPGQLTLEFIAGRRRRYVRPLPLYLSLSFLMFLLLTFFSPAAFLDLDEPSVAPVATNGPANTPNTANLPNLPDMPRTQGLSVPPNVARPASQPVGLNEFATVVAGLPAWIRPLGQRYYDSAKRIQDDPKTTTQRLTQAVTSKLPYAVFLLVPVFALNTRLLYRKRTRLYSEHFLFALHLHAFVFLSLLAGYWVAADTLAPLLFWSWFAYLTLALRRVFGGRWWVQSVRALLLMIGHGLSLALAVILTFVVSVPSI